MSLTQFTDETPTQVNRPIRVGKTLPTTCKRGELYFLIGAVNKVYASFAVNIWTEIANSSGTGSPGGTDTQVQFNDSGSFEGDANFTWDGTTLNVAGNGTLGTNISHFGPSSAGNNTFEFFALNDFLINSAGMFLKSTNDDFNSGSAIGLFSFFDNANPNGEMGTVQAGLFSVQHSGAGTLDTMYGAEVALSVSGTPGVITNAYGLNIRNVALATNNWAIKTGTGLVEFGDKCKTDSLITVAKTVATLPSSPVAGQRSFVTDSNAASFTAGIGAIVAAGGSTKVPVVYDGANWRIG